MGESSEHLQAGRSDRSSPALIAPNNDWLETLITGLKQAVYALTDAGKIEEALVKIEKEIPNIQLYFLPEYSPNFNLVELVWPSAKEYIAHRLFQSIEELQNLLDRLLNHR